MSMNDEPVRPTRPAPTPEPRKPTRPAPIANALTSVAQAVAGVVATIADAVVPYDEYSGTGARKRKPIGDMGRPQPGGEWAHLFDEDGNYTPPKDPSFKRTKRGPGPYDPNAFDVQIHKRASDYALYYLYTIADTETEAIRKAEEFGETTNLAALPYSREELPLYAMAYLQVYYDNANTPEEDIRMNELFDMDEAYDRKHGKRMNKYEFQRAQKAQSAVASTADAVAVYFGESMTTEGEEEGKAIADYTRRARDKLEEKQRIQRPDWAKFQTDNDMRITLEEYVDAENSAIEDFRDRHDDYPEEDDPVFQGMVLMRARWVTYNADTGDEVPYLVFIEAYKHATRMYEKEHGGKGDLDDSAFFQYVSDYVDMATGK